MQANWQKRANETSQYRLIYSVFEYIYIYIQWPWSSESSAVTEAIFGESVSNFKRVCGTGKVEPFQTKQVMVGRPV